MTVKQLEALFDALQEFRSWQEGRPLALGLDEALSIVQLAVIHERNTVRQEAQA